MSIAETTFCLSCGDQVVRTVHHLTEHLQRKHWILASATVLAANMFANSQSYQEVNIIIAEFDQKNAAIENMEKNKMATLQILSQKDLRIEALTKELIASEKQSVYASAGTTKLKWEKIAVDQELKKLKRQAFLTAVKMSKLSSEKMISDQKVEEQRIEIRDLQLKNLSLVQELENLGQNAESVNSKRKGLEAKVKYVQEIEAANAYLKGCVENLTAELVETKGELQKKNDTLKAKHNAIIDLEKQLYELETRNTIQFIETSKQPTWDQLQDLENQILKLKIVMEKRGEDFQERCGILITEKEKEMENMRQSFDKDRLVFEVNMDVKQKEIEDLRNKLRNASDKADLIKSNLKTLLEHF